MKQATVMNLSSTTCLDYKKKKKGRNVNGNEHILGKVINPILDLKLLFIYQITKCALMQNVNLIQIQQAYNGVKIKNQLKYQSINQ